MKLKNISEISDVKSFWDENGYLLIEDFLSEFESNHIRYLLERHADEDYNNMLNMDRYEYLIAQSQHKLNKIKKISDKVDFLGLCKETSNTIRNLLKDKRIVDLLEYLYDDELIDEHTKETGCIYNYPGSHKNGLADILEIGTGYGNPTNPGHKINIPSEFKKCDVVGKVGTLYIQHGDLIHGSYANSTKDKTRGMYSATYLPKNEKFLPGANSRRRAILV